MSVQSPTPVPQSSRVAIAAAVTAGSVLALAGVIGIALGAAFPLAVSVIEQQHLHISPGDLVLAERFAGVSWAFIVAGVAALVAAFVVPALFVSRRSARHG